MMHILRMQLSLAKWVLTVFAEGITFNSPCHNIAFPMESGLLENAAWRDNFKPAIHFLLVMSKPVFKLRLNITGGSHANNILDRKTFMAH